MFATDSMDLVQKLFCLVFACFCLFLLFAVYMSVLLRNACVCHAINKRQLTTYVLVSRDPELKSGDPGLNRDPDLLP